MTDINVDTIPGDLKERDQWLLWDDSNDTPRQPHWKGNFAISWSDPEDWHTFEEALEAAQSRESWGIGYVMAAENSDHPRGLYACIDIDGGVTERGKPKEWLPSLKPFIEDGAYMEYSPSGNGIHIPLVGQQAPEWWSDIETDPEEHEGVDFLANKFCTFTGDTLDVSGDSVADTDPEPWLLKVHKSITGKLPRVDRSEGGVERNADSELSQEELEDALSALDPDTDHEEWLHIGFAVHDWDSGPNGKAIYENWSRQGQKYDGDAEREIEWIWENADQGSGITVATLVKKATEAGWQYPRKQTTADGGAVATTAEPATDQELDPDVKLNPSAVKVRAGLGEDATLDDLDDRQKAACVWTLIRESDAYHVRVRRDNGSLWAYDGGVWKPEGERALRYAARECLGNMQTGSNVIKQLKVQARSDPSAEVEADYFGLEPGKIAVKNGLLRLEPAADGAGRDAIRPLEPDDYALSRLPVEYDPDADAEEWREFVGDVVETEKIMAVQEYVGYALHRSAMPFAKALLLVGSGSNGKSTFLNAVRELLGEDHTTTKAVHKFDEENHVADLYGSLANIDSDLSEGSLSSKGIAQFKRLVGGDTVDGRKLYEDAFSFKPSAKHLYAANQVPDVSSYVTDNDIAFWRRWIVVEFPRYIRPSERDPDLEDRLTSDETLSGILNWAIEGWGRLMDQDGFSGVESHDQTRRKWQSWGESVDKFVAECVDRDESAARISTREAYRRYEAWCRQNNEDSVGQQRLTNTLKEENVGYGRHRIDGESQRGYKALSFSEDVPHVSDETDEETDDDIGNDQRTLR